MKFRLAVGLGQSVIRINQKPLCTMIIVWKFIT